MKNNEQYIQDQLSLRLMLTFNKFPDVADVIESFNILLLKGKRKSQYIVDALTYYFQKGKDQNFEMLSNCFQLSLINSLKIYYSIETINDLKNVLENEHIYNNALKHSLSSEKPTVITLGFNKSDSLHQRVHNHLFKLDVNERLLTITKAIKIYVYSGNDPAAKMKIMFSELVKYIEEYKKDPNIINNLSVLMNL